MMNKEQKKNYISEMTTQFENSKAIMVTHYQGLTMPQLDELRSKMREKGIIFSYIFQYDRLSCITSPTLGRATTTV